MAEEISFRGTYWRERSSWSYYCPLCASPRRLPSTPSPSWKHYAQVALTSLVFSLATWKWFEWKGIVSFIPFWMVFEVTYRLRNRRAAHCANCGFDPYLYAIDEEHARAEIENHWRKAFAEKGIPYPEKPPLTGPGERR